ncbi:MAG: hypothetical protein AAB536_03695 [Patescibacteria group bacterium]
MNDIIHGLQAGFALCGFSQAVPRDWPVGHKFVEFRDIKNITCPECRQEAENLQKAREQVQERPSRRRQG